MEQFDLFGAPTILQENHGIPKKKGRGAVAKGYAAKPGTGPEGETCKTCKHRVENPNRTARVYWKCGLMRHIWTGGSGSDVRAGSPACSRWLTKGERKDES